MAGAACAVIFLAMPSQLHAQESGEQVKISLLTTLLAYERSGLSSDDGHVSVRDTAIGPGAAGTGLSIALKPSDNYLLGVDLLGSTERVTDDRAGSADAKRTAYAVLPRLEYLTAPGESLAPYLGAFVGVRGSSTSNGPGTSASFLEFVAGGDVGMRWFAAGNSSIDPNISLSASAGKEHLASSDLDRSSVTLSIGLAFSGWLSTETASRPGVAAIKAQAPASTPRIDIDDDGAMRSEIVLNEHQRVRLVGRPILDANVVLATFIDTERANTLPECGTVQVVIDGARHTVEPAPRPVPGSGSASQSLPSPAVLLSISRARDSAQLEICGSPAVLTPSVRAFFGTFFAEFESRAQRYGHAVQRDVPSWSAEFNESNAGNAKPSTLRAPRTERPR